MLGEEINEKKIEEKVCVSLPERFEAKIFTLKDSKDFLQLSLAKLVEQSLK